jgi:hypothetical protein
VNATKRPKSITKRRQGDGASRAESAARVRAGRVGPFDSALPVRTTGRLGAEATATRAGRGAAASRCRTPSSNRSTASCTTSASTSTCSAAWRKRCTERPTNPPPRGMRMRRSGSLASVAQAQLRLEYYVCLHSGNVESSACLTGCGGRYFGPPPLSGRGSTQLEYGPFPRPRGEVYLTLGGDSPPV